MTFLNGKKILTVVKTKVLDVTINVSFGYVAVADTTLITSANPNTVIENTIFSFNSSVSNNSLTPASASVSNTTVTI